MNSKVVLASLSVTVLIISLSFFLPKFEGSFLPVAKEKLYEATKDDYEVKRFILRNPDYGINITLLLVEKLVELAVVREEELLDQRR